MTAPDLQDEAAEADATPESQLASLAELMDAMGVPQSVEDRILSTRARVSSTVLFMSEQSAYNARMVEAYANLYLERGEAIRELLNQARTVPKSSNLNIRSVQRATTRLLLPVADDKVVTIAKPE